MSAGLETYAGQVRRLDQAYVRKAGDVIRAHLEDDRACALAYCPGNGTNYPLLFVPIGSVAQVSGLVGGTASGWRVPEGIWGSDGTARPGWAVVARLAGGDADFAYPFDLSEGMLATPSYVAEHCGMGFADAAALCVLFRAVCGVDLVTRSELADA